MTEGTDYSWIWRELRFRDNDRNIKTSQQEADAAAKELLDDLIRQIATWATTKLSHLRDLVALEYAMLEGASIEEEDQKETTKRIAEIRSHLNKTGKPALIRFLADTWATDAFGNLVHHYGDRAIGALRRAGKARPGRPSKAWSTAVAALQLTPRGAGRPQTPETTLARRFRTLLREEQAAKGLPPPTDVEASRKFAEKSGRAAETIRKSFRR